MSHAACHAACAPAPLLRHWLSFSLSLFLALTPDSEAAAAAAAAGDSRRSFQVTGAAREEEERRHRNACSIAAAAHAHDAAAAAVKGRETRKRWRHERNACLSLLAILSCSSEQNFPHRTLTHKHRHLCHLLACLSLSPSHADRRVSLSLSLRV